jgi:hypothetical protein
MIIFKKEYDDESLYDLGRDISEAVLEEYNPKMGDIPKNEDGWMQGTFKVTIEWEPE